MKFDVDSTKTVSENQRILFRMVAGLVVLICVIAFGFTKAYSSYTEDILYKERLGQMQEVTEQLFTGLEDVVRNQWYNADIQTNRLYLQRPSTTEQLLDFLSEQAKLSKMSELNAELIVVDNRGRYYTQSGALGFLGGMDYLVDSPDRISFV